MFKNMRSSTCSGCCSSVLVLSVLERKLVMAISFFLCFCFSCSKNLVYFFCWSYDLQGVKISPFIFIILSLDHKWTSLFEFARRRQASGDRWGELIKVEFLKYFLPIIEVKKDRLLFCSQVLPNPHSLRQKNRKQQNLFKRKWVIVIPKNGNNGKKRPIILGYYACINPYKIPFFV